MKLPKIPIGVPAGDLEVIPNIPVKRGSDKFLLKLPGDIVLAGKDQVYRIIPLADLSLKSTKGQEHIRIVVSEERPLEGASAMKQIARATAKRAPQAWQLVISAPKMTYDAVFAAARPLQKAMRDTIPVDLRIAVSFGTGKPFTTEPFRGVLAAASDRDPTGEPGTGGHFAFSCHSHWYGVPLWPNGQWTFCHGTCTTGTCLTVWSNKQWETGWCFCTCD